MDFLNFTGILLSNITISAIIITLLNHYLSRKNTITAIDKERFEFYKYIYFSAVKNALNAQVSIEDASVFFSNLCNDILFYEEKSLLLSEGMVSLLQKFYSDPCNKTVAYLQDQAEKDFIISKRKLGYFLPSIRENGFYIFSFLGMIVIFWILIILIWFTVQAAFNNESLSWLNLLLLYFLFIIIFILCLKTYLRYKYISNK